MPGLPVPDMPVLRIASPSGVPVRFQRFGPEVWPLTKYLCDWRIGGA